MIWTVTLNPAMDKTVTVSGFSAGRVNLVNDVRMDPGGKGINVSKVLHVLGQESIAVGLIGGHTGAMLHEQLAAAGIETRFLDTGRETRTNLKIFDPQSGLTTEINDPGCAVNASLTDALLDQLLKDVCPGDWVVLAGKVPAGAPADLYAHWISSLKGKGVSVAFDADRASLKLGLAEKPCLIKPNDIELSELVGRPLSGTVEIAEAAKALCAGGIGTAVVSMGAKGAVFVNADGAFYAAAPEVPVNSTTGAGDSMLAAMVDGLSRGLPFEETCRRAIAVSAAAVMRPGTQPPLQTDVASLLPRVHIEKLD